MERFLIRLGSRLHVVGEIVALVMLVKSCEQPAETSGTGGSTTTATTTDGGGGGDTGGMAGSGGATGGSGGETVTGGTGGATVTGGGGSGGTGGTTACVPSFACGPKDCGMVDDGCGTMLDCDKPSGIGDPVTCASQNANQDMGGPMTCGAEHTCECPAEGSQEAADLCDGTVVQVPGVAEFCSAAGCDASLCGTPPVAKVPESCRYAGAKADGTQVWCCAKPQS